MWSIKKGNEIDKKDWDELVTTSATSSFFQTFECFSFYQTLSFLEGFVYGVYYNNQLNALVCGYIIAERFPLISYFSRRAIVPGGLLLRNDVDTESIVCLLNAIKTDLTKKVIYIEFRNYNEYSEHRDTIESCGFEYHKHLNYKVNTSSIDSVLDNFSKSRRRQIKNAEKSGLTISNISNEIELKQFYSILKHLYSTKIKTPLFPYEFFQKLSIKPFAQLMIIKKRSEVVGGIVCVSFNTEILYEWFVCGDDRYENSKGASVMATWAGLKYASENGFRYFDFMGAGKPDTDYGVRVFKSKFGGQLVEEGRFRYVFNYFLFAIGELTVRLMKKI